MIYEFMATQDLHGWGKPWAPGANINILDPADMINGYVLNGDGTVSSAPLWQCSDFIEITPETAYYFINIARSFDRNGGCWYDENKDFLDKFMVGGGDPVIHTTSGSVTSPADAKYVRINAYGNITELAINIPATETDYTPYANVCMPEGFNIWDPSQDKMFPVYAGYVNANTRELYLRPVYQEYAGEELVGPWMSSLDPYEEDATPTEGAFVIDFGGELTSLEITPFMLQTLLDSLGIRQHFTDGAGLLNSLMDQAQGRVRSEEELLHLSRPLNVIAIGDQLPAGITFKPISKDVLPGLPGKFIR